jgi:putative ABC transport system substrate-binding protein
VARIDARDRAARHSRGSAVQSADRAFCAILSGYVPGCRPAFAIEPIEAPVRSIAEAQTVVTKLGHEGGAGLILMPDASMWDYGETVYAAADRYHLPTIYPTSSFVAAGGLLSYGIDFSDLLRGAASYADRILRGAKPSELPVQLPTKFELAINLKTAKALSLDIPPSLLAIADEVIE